MGIFIFLTVSTRRFPSRAICLSSPRWIREGSCVFLCLVVTRHASNPAFKVDGPLRLFVLSYSWLLCLLFSLQGFLPGFSLWGLHATLQSCAKSQKLYGWWATGTPPTRPKWPKCSGFPKHLGQKSLNSTLDGIGCWVVWEGIFQQVTHYLFESGSVTPCYILNPPFNLPIANPPPLILNPSWSNIPNNFSPISPIMGVWCLSTILWIFHIPPLANSASQTILTSPKWTPPPPQKKKSDPPATFQQEFIN